MRYVYAFLLLVSGIACADPILPSDAAIRQEMERLQPLVDQAVQTRPLPAQKVDVAPMAPIQLPDVKATPPALPDTPTVKPTKPSASNAWSVPPHLMATPKQPVDFDNLIRKYESAKAPEPFAKEQLYLFASFGIPEEKLKKLMAFAAEFDATVIFRGGLDEQDMSMQKLMMRVLRLKMLPRAKVQINPPLFTRFKVEVAPTWVLALPDSATEDGAGCAAPGTYASVAGDVTAEYALNLMERSGGTRVASTAAELLKRNRESSR